MIDGTVFILFDLIYVFMKVRKGYKVIRFDVMLDGIYQGTLSYEYCPLFQINGDDLVKYVEQMMPSLKGKNFNIAFDSIEG